MAWEMALMESPLPLRADLKQTSVLAGAGPILQVRTLRFKQPLTAHERQTPAPLPLALCCLCVWPSTRGGALLTQGHSCVCP